MTHKDFFFQVLDLLDKHKIQYWLMCGTLISVIRDGDFLPQDHKDTDIAIDRKDYWTVRELFNAEHKADRMLHSFIRRGELTIVSLNNKFKVDVFAMEKVEDDYYLYSCKLNSETRQWDYEWRVKYPHKLFFPLKSKMFLGRSVPIPNKAEKVLSHHYGDWKIPNPNWDSNNPPHIDNDYKGFSPAGFSYKELPLKTKKTLGFICVNFMRKECTKKTITSLQEHYDDCQIYIGDQDEPTAEMVEFYEMHNVKYFYLPHDCGLSKCRNFLIERVIEPYVMWGDNDFRFDENNHIIDAIGLLKTKKKIGVVGGSILKNNVLQHYERQLLYDKKLGILVYIPLDLTNPKEYLYKSMPYYNCDLTFNIAIAKRKVFNNKKVCWNPEIKVRNEHSDFFLRLKLYGKLSTIYFPALIAHHEHVDSSEYGQFRYRKNDVEVFAKDWKLKMNFTIGQGREIYNGTTKVIKQIDKPIIKENFQKQVVETITEYNPIVEYKQSNTEEVLYKFSKELEMLNKKYCLLDKTCLDAIKYHKLISNDDIHVGVELSTSDFLYLKNNGFKIINTGTLKYNNTIIRINHWMPNNTKNCNIQQNTYQVPYPVVSYLVKIFGCDWKSM